MKASRIFKILGPGLLYAGAAIGVSHLVQSTRAGATYGYGLLWAVVFANIIKYPFFEFAPRYTGATGHGILEGYRHLGRWALVLFILLTFSTMFTIQAAVTVVTAGLAGNLTGVELPPWAMSGIILAVCFAILVIGGYGFLDRFTKYIILLLSVTTIIAFAASFSADVERLSANTNRFDWSQKADILFLVALFGWMSAPLDISVWHSEWALARQKQTGERATMKDIMLDFKIGYWGAAVLAVFFLLLGAQIMYATGAAFSSSGVGFAGQLINLYTESIGSWAFIIIAVAAFTTMFSTTLTVFDAFPRVLSKGLNYLFIQKDELHKATDSSYIVWLLIVGSGAMVLLMFFIGDMKTMVDLATTLSFVTAPLWAVLNHIVVNNRRMPEEHRPGVFMRAFSRTGILFLSGFTAYFLYIRFFWE